MGVSAFPKGLRKHPTGPRMTNHRGRTWDKWSLDLPDGERREALLDTTWGTRFYFVYDGQWYSGSIDAFKEERPSPHFDLTRPARDY